MERFGLRDVVAVVNYHDEVLEVERAVVGGAYIAVAESEVEVVAAVVNVAEIVGIAAAVKVEEAFLA